MARCLKPVHLQLARNALLMIVLGACMFTSIDSARARETDLRERLAACATCHGEHGEGALGAEYYPHLAGKPTGYLFAQMQAFRDGRRHYPQMIYLMQFMDDAYLRDIAAWYAAQPAQLAHRERSNIPLDPASEARARELVFHGDRNLELPACARCHGDQLGGLEPGVPALTGLPTDYVIAQIGGWRTGARKALAPDCMATIANRMSPQDVRAVASWLSMQTPAAGSRPAAQGSNFLPMACGDLPVAPQDAARP